MQILPILMVMVVAGWQTSGPGARVPGSDSLLVTTVFDGDTIAVARFGRVRLLGIDAPEIGRGVDPAAPLAREARDRLSELILRRWVHLEMDGAGLDTYKRRLAYVVRDDGMFVNAALVREGLARVTARVPLRRLDELRRAEDEARRARRGIWASAAPLPRYTPRLTAPRSRAPKMRRPRKQVTQRHAHRHQP